MKRIALAGVACALSTTACFDLDSFVWNPIHCSRSDAASAACTERNVCAACDEAYDFTPFGIPSDAITQIPVDVEGGETIDSYFIAASGERAQITLVYTHGNFGSLEHYLNRVGFAYATGANVYAVDYRGFGKSSSTEEPTELEFMADVAALRARLDVELEARALPLERVAIQAHSAGALAAVEMARTAPTCGLILEAPWPSVQSFSDDSTFSAVPASFITTGAWDNIAKMPSIEAPLLQLHGVEDDFVRVEVSEQLFAAANEPKELIKVAGAGHGNGGDDVPTVLGEEYHARIAAFLDESCP